MQVLVIIAYIKTSFFSKYEESKHIAIQRKNYYDGDCCHTCPKNTTEPDTAKNRICTGNGIPLNAGSRIDVQPVGVSCHTLRTQKGSISRQLQW